jgi:hypothetical protein
MSDSDYSPSESSEAGGAPSDDQGDSEDNDRPRFAFAVSDNALIHTLIQNKEDGMFPVLDTVESGQVLHSNGAIGDDTMDDRWPTIPFLKGVVMISNPYNDYDLPRDMMAYEFEALMMIQSSGFDGHEPKTPEIEALAEYAMAHVEEFRPTNSKGPVMREDVLPMDSDHIDEATTFLGAGGTETETAEPHEGTLLDAEEVDTDGRDEPKSLEWEGDVFTDPLLKGKVFPTASMTSRIDQITAGDVGKFVGAGYGFDDLVNADPVEVAEDIRTVTEEEAEEIVREANSAAREMVAE